MKDGMGVTDLRKFVGDRRDWRRYIKGVLML